MSVPSLFEQLKFHEGLRLTAYKDTTGHLTVGIGHNLETNPVKTVIGRNIGKGESITETEAVQLLTEDVQFFTTKVRKHIKSYNQLSHVRQAVLVDMCFNMGISGLLKFKNMLKAMEREDYKQAAAEMLDSRWARQVGSRSKRLALMMEDNLSFQQARKKV